MEPEFDADPEIRLGPGDGGSLPSPCSNQEAPELQDKSKTLPSRMTISCLAELSDKKKPKVRKRSLRKCFFRGVLVVKVIKCILVANNVEIQFLNALIFK